MRNQTASSVPTERVSERPDETMTSEPSGISYAPGPKLTTHRKPGSRVNDSTPSGASSSQVKVPSPNAGLRRRSASAARYRFSMLAGVGVLRRDGQICPVRRLRQPRRMLDRSESERRLRPRPRNRYPAAVPPAHGMAGALPDRVLQHVVGQVLDLLQTELVTLIDVRASRQSQFEQHGGPGPFPTEGDVGVAWRHHADPGERLHVDPIAG